MGKQTSDYTFKNNFIIKNMTKSKKNKLNDYYTPDSIFYDKDNEIILEHSSTGDRKVHIGELTQFIEYAINSPNDKKKSLIIFLDGSSKHAPKVEKEHDRLKKYIDDLFIYLNLKYINFIGIVKYSKELNNLDLEILYSKCKKVLERR
ncbi:hypothetical protein FDF74_12180 [Clostridium niameyense]|uniref:Uncharacterized protein n=1 Tax=Clostridium niameyense TaxID=1622073 RepID=A0A6M0RE54_9CLOT|nr:hypothetical protein [Clostridium niameyense]NEZ47939.1 hypothetical protein [Clostridium niameyense]